MEDVAAEYLTEYTGQDADGNAQHKRYARGVFCDVRSVTQNEFYRAAEQDLHPDIVITISTQADYNGEKMVAYNDKLYDVIRTYWAGDEVELTLAERTGTRYILNPALVMPGGKKLLMPNDLDGEILLMPDGMEAPDEDY